MQVYYSAKQSTDKNRPSFIEGREVLSPSAGKPALVVKDWLEKNYPIEIVRDFAPVDRQFFYSAHEKSYVDAVLSGQRNNGFFNTVPEVNETLRWTSGSLLAATKQAIESKTNTCSPTSGFHHAGYSGFEKFGYFCTFNALIAVALTLQKQASVKVGILDLDQHDGNGTRDVIDKLKISENDIYHYSFGYANPRNWLWNGRRKAKLWLQSLFDIAKKFNDCDVVIYQAGADPHVDDPFGGALTDRQLRERDRIVFETIKAPIAWNLAGGYQTPIESVLSIHRATLEECLRTAN